MLAGQVIAAGIELLGVKRGVIQPCHCAGNWVTCGTMVGEELARTQRYELRLVLHVLAAAGDGKHGNQGEQSNAGLCRQINTAPPKAPKEERTQGSAWARRAGTWEPATRCKGRTGP